MAGHSSSEGRRRFRSPMPGHPRLSGCQTAKTWMPGTRPGMTAPITHNCTTAAQDHRIGDLVIGREHGRGVNIEPVVLPRRALRAGATGEPLEHGHLPCRLKRSWEGLSVPGVNLRRCRGEPGMIGEAIDGPSKLDQAREAVRAATQTVKETTQSVADAIEAGRQRGAPLDRLARWAREAPCTPSLSRSCWCSAGVGVLLHAAADNEPFISSVDRAIWLAPRRPSLAMKPGERCR